MPGLFGYKQNPKTTEMFARMSAGERFGQAVGNANQSQMARDAAAVELKRQQDMDDLSRRVQEAQIRKSDYRAPVETFINTINPNTGLPSQLSSKTNEYNDYAVKAPIQPITRTVLRNGREVTEEQDASGQYVRIGDAGPTATEIEQAKYVEKLRQEMPDARFSMDTSSSQQQDIVSLIDDMLGNQTGLNQAVGVVDEKVPNILLGNEARRFRADRTRLESDRTLEALKQLKATGATLGAVNAVEFETLKTSLTSLSLITNEKEYKEELQRIRKRIADIVTSQQELYVTKFGQYDGHRGAKGDIGYRTINPYVDPSAPSTPSIYDPLGIR
jgi:hypothetical protein